MDCSLRHLKDAQCPHPSRSGFGLNPTGLRVQTVPTRLRTLITASDGGNAKSPNSKNSGRV